MDSRCKWYLHFVFNLKHEMMIERVQNAHIYNRNIVYNSYLFKLQWIGNSKYSDIEKRDNIVHVRPVYVTHHDALELIVNDATLSVKCNNLYQSPEKTISSIVPYQPRYTFFSEELIILYMLHIFSIPEWTPRVSNYFY